MPLAAPGPAATGDDAALARAIATGNIAAFEQLMRRYNRTLFRTARAILKDDGEAEDALQEAYLLAYRSIDRFRGDARLSTWLIRIVANEALARFLGKTLGVAPSAVRVVSGASGRNKVVSVAGVDAATARARLSP